MTARVVQTAETYRTVTHDEDSRIGCFMVAVKRTLLKDKTLTALELGALLYPDAVLADEVLDIELGVAVVAVVTFFLGKLRSDLHHELHTGRLNGDGYFHEVALTLRTFFCVRSFIALCADYLGYA